MTTYQEFAAAHRADHLSPVNRWCAVLSNLLLAPAAVVAAVLGRPRTGVALFGMANAVMVTGHVVEGNLPRNIGFFLRHPLWSVRADVAVAVDTVMGLVRRQGARLS
jgi:hypothetical protein